MDALSTETLIGIENSRMKRRSINNSANITIATWVDDLQELRAKVKRRLATNIVREFMTGDSMREANERFHRKLQAAKRITIGTEQQEVGEQLVDTLNDEPPD